MTLVKLPVALRRYSGGAAQLNLPGATVGECLEELEGRFPGVREQLRDGAGEFVDALNLYLNGEDVRYLSSLDTPVVEGDVLTILLPVAGGRTRPGART